MDHLLNFAKMYSATDRKQNPMIKGEVICDGGGRWMPVVYKLAEGQFQAGVIPFDQGLGVVIDVVWTCEKIAISAAQKMAKMAAS
ncbi:hypothetical protein SAMN05444000_1124 [Shimia gijangensis]|uniref:Uncharacterized protein n=2 Tax=Shimia gijangensis TaxID=1470563 RepID=A0A1M6LHR6_9RHOB|nr:hypothetical protein SAMN05444000_1124 [Shimia gijangensis]